MNSEENKNQNLNYDFNFENQVVKNENSVENNALEEDEFEEIVETNNDAKENNIDTNLATDNEKETSVENETKEENTEKVKIVKILGKEFNFEDIILAVIGLVLIVSIFIMPKIMNMFK